MKKLLLKVLGVQGREEQMSEAILKYLAEHPQAMDTLDGIAQWWLMRQNVRVEVDLLSEILRHLTEKGLLQMSGDKNNPLYRLNK